MNRNYNEHNESALFLFLRVSIALSPSLFTPLLLHCCPRYAPHQSLLPPLFMIRFCPLSLLFGGVYLLQLLIYFILLFFPSSTIEKRRPQIWAFKVLGICLKMTDHSNEGAVTVNKESKASVNLQMENEEQKEQLLAKIMELEKQLDKKHKLELDMEQSLKEYGDLVQMLIIKEHRSNEELLEIRKELINGIKELSTHADIGVKRVGELDTRPFLEAMMLRYKDEEAGQKAAELCSLWQGYLSNPGWHPFRIVTVEGKSMEVIYEDEKLKGLKNDIGEGAYKAVVEALKEMNEYNPIARCVIPELWNYKQGRSATSLEGVRFLLKQWRNERAANFMVV